MNIFSKFSSENNKEEIFKLWEKIRNRSSILNRSRPQSVISALIYYMLREEISLEEFSEKVQLSKNTIKKNMNEIITILK